MIDLAARELLALAKDCQSAYGVTLPRVRARKVATAINNVLVRLEIAESKPPSLTQPEARDVG